MDSQLIAALAALASVFIMLLSFLIVLIRRIDSNQSERKLHDEQIKTEIKIIHSEIKSWNMLINSQIENLSMRLEKIENEDLG